MSYKNTSGAIASGGTSYLAGELANRYATRTLVAKGIGGAAGIVIQPAVWMITGTKPDAADKSLYSVGALATILGSGLVAGAVAVTSVVKGIVDDYIDERRDVARAAEPLAFRPYIFACYRYGGAGDWVNARIIASRGGTAWKHPNGIWLYITDARGRLVCNYKPRVAEEIYQPIIPLVASSQKGGFRLTVIR